MPDTEAGCVLTIDFDRVGGETTVRCRGRLVAGVDNALYTQVSQLIPGSKRIVMDLTDLKHMDSMGLGALVRLYVSTKSADCEFVLINLGQQIRHLLGLTNLFSVFTAIGENGVRLM
jgi:anti-anti-sigma factor